MTSRVDEPHSTVPSFDHENGGGMGLYSHLINDHKRMPAMFKFARESERISEHRKMHKTK